MKLVHLVGLFIRIYHDARSPESQKPAEVSLLCSIKTMIRKINRNSDTVHQKIHIILHVIIQSSKAQTQKNSQN